MDRQTSSCGRYVPNIIFKDESDADTFTRRLLPDPKQCVSISLASRMDRNRSCSCDSLVPEYVVNSNPRGSLVPNLGRLSPSSPVSETMWSPRHSRVLNSSLSPQQSLMLQDFSSYNRSPGNSPVRGATSPRIPFISDSGISRNQRYSLIPGMLTSPRGNVINMEFNRESIRHEIRSDWSKEVTVGVHANKKGRTIRGFNVSDYLNQSPYNSTMTKMPNRSSCAIAFDANDRISLESIEMHEMQSNRSPRSSIGKGNLYQDSCQGSICSLNIDSTRRSPCGSIGTVAGFNKSPRGRFNCFNQDKQISEAGYNVQEFRRSFGDQGCSRNRSTSPYRHERDVLGSSQLRVNTETQVHLGYGTTNSKVDSRRFSVAESRRLYNENINKSEKGSILSSRPTGAAAYGSFIFELKDAYHEANGMCDFIFRGLKVLSKTMFVIVLLVIFSIIPILMFIIGIQFIKDCPREPYIPVYMIVGGILGGIRMFWTLYSQIRLRRVRTFTVPTTRTPNITPLKLTSIALTCFLLVWFGFGNYWILSIRWPNYKPMFYERNLWCDKTLYIFSLSHLCVVYISMLQSYWHV
ncbi:PREDICTED: uncharacterized protein LOC105366150 [Ceratosolen solmsi marchali]|uniref:Uncharacterized protein LOC105366150 n=1 Tax=Ceratosolen solmsi marchali TaxID=326594 RepID=A0AAJ7E041_9HYME|nr:PREDICTED: uncharacterized protein LOC105366150 [Ceratosolen solmsi marchali]